jgi:hypothetical protein
MSVTPMDADPYLPLKALSAYAGLSVRTLRGYLTDLVSPLPHYKVKGKILVKHSDYDVWFRQFRRTASSSLNHIVDDIVESLR